MSTEVKKYFISRSKLYLTFLASGIVYYVWLKLTGLGIPCIYRKVSGLLCPGCGVTTMFVKIFSGDFVGAFSSNAFVFGTSPVILFLLLFNEYTDYQKTFHKDLKKANKRNAIILTTIAILELIGALAFGILRNII